MEVYKKVLVPVFERKVRFVLVFFGLFTALYATLYIADFLPEPKQEVVEETKDAVIESEPEELVLEDQVIDEIVKEPEMPVSIYIEKLDKTVAVLNPESRMIADLDAALLNGVVRHPDSAALNQEGNVFILGHSSYLPVVYNKNYQAFNGIQNLAWGDVITVSSEESVFTYRVEKVYKAKASEVTVPIADTGSMLTIATCNSFGSTDDRYIVEASLQESVNL